MKADDGVWSAPNSDPRADSYRPVHRHKAWGMSGRASTSGDRSRSMADGGPIARRNSQSVLCVAIVAASGIHKGRVKRPIPPLASLYMQVHERLQISDHAAQACLAARPVAPAV